MTRYTLINCDFLLQSTFLKLSNKAKLLYYAMLTNADSLGVVGTCDTIIDTMVKCDDNYEQAKLLGLQDQLTNEYVSAKIELVNKCYLYLFTDKLGNEIFVIKHWFIHNKYRDNLETNYKKIIKQLKLVDGEYQFGNHTREKTIFKESKRKEGKATQSKYKKENKVFIEKKEKDDISTLPKGKDKSASKERLSDEEWDKLLDELESVSPNKNNDNEESEII